MLLDDNFEMQGGVRNYLGKTEEVKAPKYWKSSKDSPKTELAYITEAEKGLLLDANLHGSLKDGKPNVGASGLLSYDGWGDTNSDGSSDTSGGNAGAEGGQGSGNSNDSYSGGGSSYTTPTPASPPGVTPTSNFDYETEAYTGVGEIESNFFNPETGEFSLKQTPGVINVADYQTSNIGAYLDSPGVSDKDKTDFLGRLKAISNSDLIGTNVVGIEDKFIIDNLDISLNSIIDQTKYSKYTDNISEVAKTFEKDLKTTPLSTIGKSGGVLGTFFRGLTDNYKNNKAMDLLGYTGSTIKYNPDGSGDFNYGGGFLTGNASQGERDAVNQLTPFAADAIGGTTNQPSMVNQYFSNMGSNLGVSSAYMDTYNAAKANIANTLNLQPNNQQYGYGNTFNDTYARSMTSANPFEEELTNQGLI